MFRLCFLCLLPALAVGSQASVVSSLMKVASTLKSWGQMQTLADRAPETYAEASARWMSSVGAIQTILQECFEAASKDGATLYTDFVGELSKASEDFNATVQESSKQLVELIHSLYEPSEESTDEVDDDLPTTEESLLSVFRNLNRILDFSIEDFANKNERIYTEFQSKKILQTLAQMVRVWAGRCRQMHQSSVQKVFPEAEFFWLELDNFALKLDALQDLFTLLEANMAFRLLETIHSEAEELKNDQGVSLRDRIAKPKMNSEGLPEMCPQGGMAFESSSLANSLERIHSKVDSLLLLYGLLPSQS